MMVPDFKPTLKLFKTMWGVPEIGDKTKWKDLFARIKADGFSGVEMHGVFFMMPGISDALKNAGLELIG